MKSRWPTLILAVVLAAALAGGYRLIRSDLAMDVYRQRLATVTRAHQQLAATYNEAVKKTAVTELLVRDGKLAVVVRNAAGVMQRFDAPYDPAGEIYVDYIVANGRLWIRRVYDAATPPSLGLVIDPTLADFDWRQSPSAVGKAVYRRLDEGRWIVTVTGEGSLGLARVGADEPEPQLAAPPPVKDYDQVQAELDAEVERIGPWAVLRHFATPGG